MLPRAPAGHPASRWPRLPARSAFTGGGIRMRSRRRWLLRQVRGLGRMRPVVALALGVGCGLAASSRPAAASGPLLFQHGGRPTGQVGAFVARAEDAGAIVYNPASLARLRGAHYQLGFDYTAPVDEYHSATGSFEQDKLITESPALYATWHLPESYYPWSFGLGVDEPAWYLADWAPALFPGRFLTRKQKLQLWSIHPVVGLELGERWSIGAGLRYYMGKL